MSSIRNIIAKAPARISIQPVATHVRLISSTAPRLVNPPPGNQPPSSQKHGRSSQPVEDPQSSASTQMPEEHNTGDHHPAKQPDTQAPSERSTGFMENQKDGKVKGGKEGLDQRTDK